MREPRFPITREARDFLSKKLDRMKGIEKKKTIKRLEMHDRGYKYVKDGGRVIDKTDEPKRG